MKELRKMVNKKVSIWVPLILLVVLCSAVFALAQQSTVVSYHELIGERYVVTDKVVVTRNAETVSMNGSWEINFRVSEKAGNSLPCGTTVTALISIDGSAFVPVGELTTENDNQVECVDLSYDTSSATYPDTIVIKVI